MLFALGLWLPVVAIGLGCLNGGCACESCEICADNFDRDDDTDVDTGSACGWTETAGSWEIVDDTLRTASSSATLDCDATHPDATPTHYVKCDLYGANGDELRIGVGDHYAQLKIGDPNGCLALYAAGGTLLSKIRVEAAATTMHTVEVWYGTSPVADGGDSQIVARLGSAIVRYNVTRAGASVYLGTGTVASTVRFDNFEWQRHYTTYEDDSACPKPPAPSCTIVSDSFTRADDTDLGCGWTETAGAWSISGNKLTTSSASATVTCETLHPRNKNTITVTVNVRASAASSQSRIYVDVANNDYAQLAFSGAGSTVKLFLAGVEVGTSTVTLALDQDYPVKIVRTQGVVSVLAAGVCLNRQSVGPNPPRRAALGTGTNAGVISFSSFVLTRSATENTTEQDCSKGCINCSYCTDDNPPETVFVTVFDVYSAMDVPGCDDLCTYLNGKTFALAFDGVYSASGYTYCRWSRLVNSNRRGVTGCFEIESVVGSCALYEYRINITLELRSTGVLRLLFSFVVVSDDTDIYGCEWYTTNPPFGLTHPDGCRMRNGGQAGAHRVYTLTGLTVPNACHTIMDDAELENTGTVETTEECCSGLDSYAIINV